MDNEQLLSQAEELLSDGDLQGAQAVLNGIGERGGKWHYLQSVIFYRKNWFSESKKQLEFAIKAEPENEQYKEALEKLEKHAENAVFLNDEGKPKQMGKRKFCSGEGCAEACAEGCCAGGIECCCTGICEGLGGGC